MAIHQRVKSNYITRPKPLGMHLLEADLVSSFQLKLALKDQEYYSDLRLGEILALRGWLKQETADFFAQDWQKTLRQRKKMPLGFYLKQSGLLEEEDIDLILQQHAQTGIRFGTVAVIQGLLKPSTLDFFIMHLCPKEVGASPFISPQRTGFRQYKPWNSQIITPKNINKLENEFEAQFFENQQIEDIEESIIWVD